MNGYSMMGSSPGAMALAANQRMARADAAIQALADPMLLVIEHGIQFLTFGATGYVSGRWSNPKPGGVPYELLLGVPFTALGLAAMTMGKAPVAGRIADQVGTIMLGTYVFKFMAGFGKSHAGTTAAAPPAGGTKQAGTGAFRPGFTRQEITGSGPGFRQQEIVGAGMGALSAAEAARLSR